MNGVQLWFDPIVLEQMLCPFIFCHPFGVAWDQHFHLRLCDLIAVLAFYKHFFHVICIHVADSTFD